MRLSASHAFLVIDNRPFLGHTLGNWLWTRSKPLVLWGINHRKCLARLLVIPTHKTSNMMRVLFFQPARQAFRALLCVVLGVAIIQATPAMAQRSQSDDDALPAASRLLPFESMVYIRLDSVDRLKEQFTDGSMGRMLNDPKMQPFAEQAYATGAELFELLREQLGVSLDELLDIPQGQVAFALHPSMPMDEKDIAEIAAGDDEEDEERRARRETRMRRQQEFGVGVTLIIDAGQNIGPLMTLVERFEAQVLKGPFNKKPRDVEGTEIVRLMPSRAGQTPIEYFERDGVFVMGVGYQSAETVLMNWLGKSEEKTLADNADFGVIVSNCIGSHESEPAFTFFVDPHAIVDRLIDLNGGVTTALFWGMFEDLGASRIGGIGGASFYGGESFESIAHYFIAIDPPRDGLLGVLRPLNGDTTPPQWIPEDVAGYTSIHWDIEKTYDNIGNVIDQFQGPESLKRFVETPVQNQVGVDLKGKVLPNLTGRMLRLVWMEPPNRVNSGTNLFALEVKDAGEAKNLLAELRDKLPNMKVDTVGGKVVYRLSEIPEGAMPPNFRTPEPSLMLLDNWMIYCDSTKFIERAILAKAGNLPRLLAKPDYELVTAELTGQLKSQKPFLLSYIDGAQAMEVYYELLRDPNTKRFVRGAAEGNPVLGAVANLLDENELPPFSEMKKYFAPTGIFGYNDPSGIHFGMYSLRPLGLDE